MTTRFDTIGIKQTIHLEWMQKTTDMLLAGIDTGMLRHELHELLSASRTHEGNGGQSKLTRGFAVGNLMKIWVCPDSALIPLRDALLLFVRDHPSMFLPVHWAMISAAYPFWFNTALQTGRLLALQDKITQSQIVSRLKSQYGDRQTISRYSQYIIRAFVDWGVLQDINGKGQYEKGLVQNVSDPYLLSLLFESILLSANQPRIPLRNLYTSPSLFPFKLAHANAREIASHNLRLEDSRYGMEDEYLALK